jgi:hypothetical protein
MPGKLKTLRWGMVVLAMVAVLGSLGLLVISRSVASPARVKVENEGCAISKLGPAASSVCKYDAYFCRVNQFAKIKM